ncbi:Transcription factor [Nymphaea thermarum]|nr:Transcription factor [Nymphaea thermarum]
MQNGLLLINRKISPLDVRPQVVGPSQPATFPAPVETGKLRESPPTSMAVLLDVVHKLLVFLRGNMGRSPCCDESGLKKGPWTPEEDQKLERKGLARRYEDRPFSAPLPGIQILFHLAHTPGALMSSS